MRSISANAAIMTVFAVWTILLLPCACVLLLLGMTGDPSIRRLTREAVWFYGRSTLALLSPFIPVRLRDRDVAKRCAPCIIVANHQSFLDLFLLGAQNERNLCLISKSWPYRRLFFFAPIMRAAGYIDAERLSPEELERRCLQRLAEGATLVVFPEGRRTRDGGLGRFHAGAFRLSCLSGLPVAPLVIVDSYAVFRVGSSRFTPGTVTLRMLPPVYPGAFSEEDLPHRAMMRRVRHEVAEALSTSALSEKAACFSPQSTLSTE